MAKYYVQSANLRLVLDAGTARDAAMRAVQWCQDRRAEVFREPAGDRIRDIEILDWQVDRQIRVSETGFGQSDGRVFETSSLEIFSLASPSRSAFGRVSGSRTGRLS